MIKATVICDASFKKAGGRYIAGWAAWVRVDGKSAPICLSGPIRAALTTSTEAEVYAALNGIWLARRQGAHKVMVRSDCMAVEQLIQGKTKASLLRTIWQAAMDRPDLQGVQLVSRHVKAHGRIGCAGTYVNDWCDRMAKAEMRKQERLRFHGRFDS